MKKILILSLILLVVLTIGFIGSGCKSVATETTAAETTLKELTPVVWAIDSNVVTLPQRAAEELGFFEEEGIDIELKVNASGVNTMEMIIAEAADLGSGAHYAMSIWLSKPNLGLGGFTCNGPSFKLMVSPEIQKLSDLKGKNIATVKGAVWDWLINKALEKGGLTEADANLLNFGGGAADYMSAAAKGDVDAAFFFWDNLPIAKKTLEPLDGTF